MPHRLAFLVLLLGLQLPSHANRIGQVPPAALPASLAPFAPRCATPCDAPARLRQIADAHFEARLALNPVLGSQLLGEERFEGHLALALDPAYRERERRLNADLLLALRAPTLQRAALDPAERVTLELLQHEARDALTRLRHPDRLLPLNQYGGLPVQLAEWAGGQNIQQFKTPLQYEGFLRRLEQLPRWTALAQAALREGLRRGIVANRDLIERSLPSLRQLADAPLDDHPYAAPLRSFPAGFDAELQQRLRQAYRQRIAEVLQPALRDFVRFVERDYLPRTRQSAGLGALPGGQRWYRDLVASHTTSALNPAAIHALGQREVARVRAEMDALRRQVGYAGTLDAFLKDEQWPADLKPYGSEAEILARYDELNRRVEAALPALFLRRPKAALEIRAEPEISRSTASDHYEGPALDGSRPGVFYAVIQDPKDYERSQMTALLLHEGQPGHHFQTASQQELDAPQFRRHYWTDAYGEGWALYAETLGHEMGLYRDDPVARLGQLRMRLHRAIRLVVDTGLHAQGWSRARTIAYIQATEGASADSARRATERYMADPGQALAYMVGALKIEQLRHQAERRLGARFRLADFHAQVLGLGCVPLDILEREIKAWLRRQAAA